MTKTVLGFTLAFLLAPILVWADFNVSPLIIDEVTEGRDIITRNLTLTNSGARVLRLYAGVHELSPDSETEIKQFVPPSMSDRTSSITSWLEITRARIEIQPGETRTIPLTIRIHPNVVPGNYHGFIGLATGVNRDEAETKIMSGTSLGVILRLSVGDKLKEQLQLTSFVTDRFSLGGDSHQLSFTLSNRGDLPVTPSGEVIIYDSRGHEIGSVALNLDGHTIAPGQDARFTEATPFSGRLGRHKAYLSVDYGAGQTASVYDTAFYLSLPWQYLLLVFFGLVTILTTLVLAMRKLYTQPVTEPHPVQPVSLRVRAVKNHQHYDHDIDLSSKS